MTRDINIVEVGPRDGLQNLAQVLEPAVRAQLATRLVATRPAAVEAVSFVRADRVPAMADAEQVVSLTLSSPEVVMAGLVLNLRGYRRLARTSLDAVRMAVCATEEFNRRNQGCGVDETMSELVQVISAAHEDGRVVTATVAVAFGCPFEGPVDPGRVRELAHRLAASGADELVLADTIGVATPRQVGSLVGSVAGVGVPIGVHLHNTRNAGYANAYAAIASGAVILDSSAGGIGGCPFAPRATGNIATEDLVAMLEGDGIRTGIDLDQLLDAVGWLSSTLQTELPGLLVRAGPRLERDPREPTTRSKRGHAE